MASKIFETIIKDALNEKAAGMGKDLANVTYDITTTARSTELATISVKLEKPLPQADILPKSKSILRDVAESLNAKNIGIMDALLVQLGVSRKRVGRKKTTGNVKVNLGVTTPDADDDKEFVKSVSGQTTDVRKLRGILELVAKKYLIRGMKAPNAPLKYRTGRFANSLKVTSIATTEVDTAAADVKTGRGRRRAKPKVSILYTYMTYPYATFDPKVSNRPEMYMKPFYGARNPQLHIGEAIAKAARDLMFKGYDIDVTQRK